MTRIPTTNRPGLERCCLSIIPDLGDGRIRESSPKFPAAHTRSNESGATLIVLMGMMVLFAIALLAVAPSVQYEVQREKELESIRRGEEIADAIRQYVIFYRGQKLPNSIDDLLEGLPQGTKKRQILRPSAATDPLSEDGKWRLIKPDPQTVARFAKKVQEYNNGVLPSNPTQLLDRFSVIIVNSINTDPAADSDDLDFEVVTDNQPFIGVASQDRGRSILTYYGLDRHSSWIFTPLFRGASTFNFRGGGRPIRRPIISN